MIQAAKYMFFAACNSISVGIKYAESRLLVWWNAIMKKYMQVF